MHIHAPEIPIADRREAHQAQEPFVGQYLPSGSIHIGHRSGSASAIARINIP